MIWFTSDCHFSHTNICTYCNRPFADVKEMNGRLIANWNQCVQPKDDIYHLGDFCFGNPMEILPRLLGNIYLIEGSHDKGLKRMFEDSKSNTIGNWHWLGPQHSLSVEGQSVTLCHYAMRRWPKSHYGSWHLFGHSHGRLPSYGLSFDVGVDAHPFTPWAWYEIKTKMATLKPEGLVTRGQPRGKEV